MNLLSVADVSFAAGETKILNGISFKVARGEQVGIIGPNGSGKTTLFNCLSGFNIPQSGKITFNREEITELTPHERAQLGLGRVFQNFGVFKEMTVAENILTALETKEKFTLCCWGAHARTLRNRVDEHLEMVGLQNKAEQKAGSLSGGQMRLLEIVRAIAFGAELFLLDEPTAGVSPKMKDEVEGLLKKLSELNKTVLIIEHDMNFIQKLCQRILVLDSGKILLDDTPEKVRKSPVLQEIYFGTNSR